MNKSTTDWRQAFTKEEIAELREHSDWRGWLMLISDYGMVAASMALVAFYPKALTVIVALVVIGTRQLGLAIHSTSASVPWPPRPVARKSSTR